MAFFDELGKAISGKSREAATKVRDLTEILQLKSKLSSEKEKVNKAYINLGKAYYDRHEVSAEEEYADDFEAIRAGLLEDFRAGGRNYFSGGNEDLRRMWSQSRKRRCVLRTLRRADAIKAGRDRGDVRQQ